MSGLQIKVILLVVVYAIAAFVLFLAFFSHNAKEKMNVSRRLTNIRGKDQSIFSMFKNKGKRIEENSSNMGLLGKLIDTIYSELSLAGIKMKPEEFILIWMIAALIPSSLTALVCKQIIPSFALAIIGAALPVVLLQSKKKKRVSTFDNQLSDALVVCCNCLKSGLSFQQAMETIASDCPAPISTEFARAISEVKLGSTLDAALDNMTKRVKSPDLKLMVSAINVQRGTGGNLSTVLDTISETIRDRLKIKNEIKTVTAQGRVSSSIIGALPIVIALILMLINPSYIMIFFTTSIGNIMLIASIVLEVIGFIVIRKVVTVKY